MSEKFDQLKIMQEMFPNATFVDANGERVADASKTLDHIAGVSKKVSLTEQWKKGELEEGWYYIEIDAPFEQRIKDVSHYSLGSFDIDIDSNYISEVLAEVPDYIEWKNYVNGFCDEHEYNLKLSEENQKLKEEIKTLKEAIYDLDGLECPKCGNYHRRGWTCSQCGYGK